MTADTTIHGGDAIIIGGGLAGLFTALKLAPLKVTVLARKPLGTGASTAWAQGGIAAALAEGDTAAAHAADTVAAGAGLVDPEIALLIAEHAAARIRDLAEMGVPFDKQGTEYLLGREAAHSANRIVHVKGDQAGRAVMQTLIARAQAADNIQIIENARARGLIKTHGAVTGVHAQAGDEMISVRAPAVVMATGGVGGIFRVTTNPPDLRGEGLALAARAGAVIADPEFVQFHPTALDIGTDPAPLATEALRGEGAVLTDDTGARFIPDIHPDAELGPRDVVARAVQARINAGHTVFLDCRAAIGAAFPERFPAVTAAAKAAGIDPVTDPLPVAPAMHYHMGGIATDADGHASLPGLYACGECAATGAHGANRLASNSLLEALVFGDRIARHIRSHRSPADIAARSTPPPPTEDVSPRDPALMRLREAMSGDVGLLRSDESLGRARDVIDSVRSGDEPGRLADVLAAAQLITDAARARTESRGGHFRTDYPDTATACATRQFLRWDEILHRAVPVADPFTAPARKAAP